MKWAKYYSRPRQIRLHKPRRATTAGVSFEHIANHMPIYVPGKFSGPCHSCYGEHAVQKRNGEMLTTEISYLPVLSYELE
jgi:hypothetical protein